MRTEKKASGWFVDKIPANPISCLFHRTGLTRNLLLIAQIPHLVLDAIIRVNFIYVSITRHIHFIPLNRIVSAASKRVGRNPKENAAWKSLSDYVTWQTRAFPYEQRERGQPQVPQQPVWKRGEKIKIRKRLHNLASFFVSFSDDCRETPKRFHHIITKMMHLCLRKYLLKNYKISLSIDSITISACCKRRPNLEILKIKETGTKWFKKQNR